MYESTFVRKYESTFIIPSYFRTIHKKCLRTFIIVVHVVLSYESMHTFENILNTFVRNKVL
jgi:hypothetical protein